VIFEQHDASLGAHCVQLTQNNEINNMPGNQDYPPQFSESAISSAIGTVNDFAGSEGMEMRSAAAPSAENQRAMASLASVSGGIPVVITGTRPPTNTPFPGLREAMIGSAIFQLAAQVPDDNPIKKRIQELALELHYSGGDKIVRQRSRKGKKRG
jgi:hypothetical protein